MVSRKGESDMQGINLDKIMNELNRISRMAIIENAPDTEKMLTTLMKFLKYRYNNKENAIVTQELRMAKSICNFYKLKTGRNIEFIAHYDENQLNSFLVPSFSILSFYYCLLESINENTNDDALKITTSFFYNRLDIQFQGEFDFETLYKDAYEFLVDEHISIKKAINSVKGTNIEVYDNMIQVHIPLE